MSEIRAGDLVMVVKATPCCGDTSIVGKVFAVIGVGATPSRCTHCSMPFRSAYADGIGISVRVSRLIRIDPPAQPESIETDREVVA